jgi:hypothetical protein
VRAIESKPQHTKLSLHESDIIVGNQVCFKQLAYNSTTSHPLSLALAGDNHKTRPLGELSTPYSASNHKQQRGVLQSVLLMGPLYNLA